jgi:exopolysaccharide production protein ExoQ
VQCRGSGRVVITPSNAEVPANRRWMSQIEPRQFRWLLISLAIMAYASFSALSIIFSGEAEWVVFLPLGLIAAIMGAWLIWRAAAGSQMAIMVYLSLVVFITDAEFRIRGAGETNADWQSILKFGLWVGAGIIGFSNLPRLQCLLTRLGPFLWLAFLAVAVASSAYAPTPAYSFGCAFSLVCFFAFAFAVVELLSEGQILWTIALTFAVFLMAGWAIYYVDPALGISEFPTYSGIELRMCGLAGQANDLGSICAKYLGAVFLLWSTNRCRTTLAIALACLGVSTLVASDARTGMIAITVAIVVATLAGSFRGLVTATLLVVAGSFFATISSLRMDDFGARFSRSGDPTEVFTLTGRLQIWSFVWEKIEQAPLFGWGYNASKVILPQYAGFSDGLLVDTAHNMLLQNMLSVGIVGTLPVVALLFYLLFQMILHPYRFRDVFFIIIFTMGLTDTRALGSTPSSLTLLFFIITLVPQPSERNRVLETALDTIIARPAVAAGKLWGRLVVKAG